MNTRVIWARGLTPSDKGKRVTVNGVDYILHNVEHLEWVSVLSVLAAVDVAHDVEVRVLVETEEGLEMGAVDPLHEVVHADGVPGVVWWWHASLREGSGVAATDWWSAAVGTCVLCSSDFCSGLGVDSILVNFLDGLGTLLVVL